LGVGDKICTATAPGSFGDKGSDVIDLFVWLPVNEAVLLSLDLPPGSFLPASFLELLPSYETPDTDYV